MPTIKIMPINPIIQMICATADGYMCGWINYGASYMDTLNSENKKKVS